MAIAILLGVLLLLVLGLVIALRTAAAARRELEDLEGEFAETRDSLAVDTDSDPEPWSSFDLAILRDDVIVVDGNDPFDTLTEANWPAGWHASQGSHGWEHAPASWAASQDSNGSEPTSTTDLAPVDDLAPVTWRAPVDAPIIILVVGVGFLGTGMTAGVTTATRLRRAWGEVQDSFAQARVITLDPDASHAASSAFDPGAVRDGIVVDEGHDPFPTQENGDSRVSWPPPRPNGLGPRPPGEPKPIEWRAPGGVAAAR